MNELLVGYACVSTEQQDLTAQRNGLQALGVGDDRIYVDHGLTGTNRDRPGLRLALAACRAGDTLVVTKLERPVGGCRGHHRHRVLAGADLAGSGAAALGSGRTRVSPYQR
jgi:hypothetical protein